MKKLWYYVVSVCCVLSLSACSNDDDDPAGRDEGLTRLATVTYLTTPNGLGDIGYNDVAAEGIFAFAGETWTRLRLLLPKDEAEAEMMYRQWLAENAAQDSAVLILGSSVYEDMARRIGQLDNLQFDNYSRSSGSRVLLFESDAEIDGISSVIISRYGVSWLAGAMSQGFDALVLTATPGITLLEESIAGFQEARAAYAGEFEGRPCQTTVHYLSEGASGFAIPDSAYRYISRRADKAFFYDELIFPLLGGSEAGVLRYLNDNWFATALMVGMDVDQTGQSSRIPFSVVIRIGDVLKKYLADWLAGREWPARQRLGMKDSAADIVITPRFSQHLMIWDDRYGDPDTFQRLYNQYKDEAIRKEDTYENK
jgi:basic membrane lipoprotein Med (substrate-binding protein (PBP1-ABC) superfamily)